MKIQRVEDTKILMNIHESKDPVLEKKEEELEVEEEEKVEEIPAEEIEEKEVEVSLEEPVKEEPKDQSVISFSEALNHLTQDYWNIISFIKSLKVMLQEQEVAFNKEDIINILSSLSDDATIDVGMLAKASELIDNSTKLLMDMGTEKAEEIISETAVKDLEVE